MSKAVSDNRRVSSSTYFYLACLLFAILKMVIASHEEIIAREQFRDDLWHILAAARGYWFGSEYTSLTFIHLPVYSLWIGLVYFTGVPLRVATEVLFLASAFLFVLSLSRIRIDKFYCAVIYCSIIFHPASFQLFNYSLAEMLYAPLFLVALAFLVMMWESRGQKNCLCYAVGFGISCSLLWYLRKENVLILSLIFLITVMAVVILRKEALNWSSVLKQVGILGLVPVGVILVFSLTIQTINYKKFGLFAPTELSSAGYTAAYKALLRIKPEHSIRFVPVTTEVRKSAYSVSPAFKELEPYLEKEGYPFECTRRYMGINGEIAAGWFYWALRDAAALAGHHSSARAADAYYQRVANEINGAIDTGRLPGRFVPTTFLDPEVTNYLRFLPESFEKICQLFVSTHQPARERDCGSSGVQKAFDIVANRRSALTGQGVVTISGWAFGGRNSRMHVLLKSSKGEVLGRGETSSPRPDVARRYAVLEERKVPQNCGFSLMAFNDSQKLDDALLIFATDDGSNVLSVPYKNIVAGKPSRLRSQTSEQVVTFAVDTMSTPKVLSIYNDIQYYLWSFYGNLIIYLSYVGIFAIIVIACCYRVVDLRESIYGVLVLLLFSIVTRIVLFTLLDASSWPGNQPRYLFPVMPVYSCFLLLLNYQAIRVVAARFGRKHEARGVWCEPV